MARQPRPRTSDAVWWIHSGTGREEPLFRSAVDRQRFLRSLQLATRNASHWQLWSWVLLREDYHLVARASTRSLTAVVRDCNAAYAHYRGGSRLFARRFSAIIVDPESYLAPLLGWMFAQPAARGLSRDAASWRWSSYSALVRQRPPLIPLESEDALGALGGGHAARQRLRRAAAESLTDQWRPHASVEGQRVLGSLDFLRGLPPPDRRPAGVPSYVIEAVARRWNLQADDVVGRAGKEARLAAVLLMRERGVRLAEIGRILGIGESAVSRLASRARKHQWSEQGLKRLDLTRSQLESKEEVNDGPES